MKFQEVYAAFLEHTDRELGRLVTQLEQLDLLDDTIVVVLADNGASQEGFVHGVLDTTTYENGRVPSLEESLARIDEIDGHTAHVNYPLGWAQAANTPLKRYKQNTHAGGIRTPLVMRLPDGFPRGTRRHGFQHVTDILPTVLDLVGVSAPDSIGGHAQMPFDGISFAPELRGDRDGSGESGESRPRTQYFETVGHRAVVRDGWKAVAYHRRGEDFDTDQWELYHLDEDFSEHDDLAQERPDKLSELVDAWWAEARRHQVLPLDDRGFAERASLKIRPHSPRDRERFVYLRGSEHVGTGAAPVVANRHHVLSARISRPDPGAVGVLLAHGGVCSGYALLVEDDGRLAYHLNHYGDHQVLRSPDPLPLGPSHVAAQVQPLGRGTAMRVQLLVDDVPVCDTELPETFEHFIAFQGLDVGVDALSPVRGHGADPFPFTGDFEEVVVEIPGSASTPRRTR